MKLYRAAAALTAISLSMLPLNIFAQEEESSEEVVTVILEQAETDLQDNPVTLTLVPEGEEEAEIPIVSYELSVDGEPGWQLVNENEELSYSVSAQMSDVTEGENNGNVDLESIHPALEEDYLSNLNGNMFNNTAMLGTYSAPSNYTPIENDFEDYEYRYVSSDVRSSVVLNSQQNGVFTVYQFELMDESGNISTVYCADLATTAVVGAGYNVENVEDVTYFEQEGAADHIKAIALNGYWGTNEGLGSLESVKQLLRDKTDLSESLIKRLTPGMAMSATQAALWYYGDSSAKTTVDYDNPANAYYINPYTFYDGSMYITVSYFQFSDQQKLVMKTLIQTLIDLQLEEEQDNTTTLISKNNFATEAAIVLKGQDASNPDIFKTDISFSLEVVPTENDDLVVLVKDGDGQVIASRRIAGALCEGEQAAVSTATDTGMMYTIEDIELADGVTITLNLAGTQALSQGVYIYTADVYTDSQTFVGIAQGTKDVDLEVSLSFNASAPEVEVQRKPSETQNSEEGVEEEGEEVVEVSILDKNNTGKEEEETEEKEEADKEEQKEEEKENIEEETKEEEEDKKEETTASESLVKTAAASHMTMVMASACGAALAGLLVWKRKH